MNRSCFISRCVILAAVVLASATARAAEVRVSTSDQLFRALAGLKAGDTLLLAPGKYRGGLSHGALRGTKEQAIVIAGADPAQPPVIEGGTGGMQLSSPEFVELRNLTFTGARGNGLNIDDSGSTRTPARHVLLKNLTVRDVGPNGNRDGIKLSGVTDFRLEGCTIERWGSDGSAVDMVGCKNGVITGCTIRNATGDGANGVQTKGGTSDIVIRQCRFQAAGARGVNVGGSTGLAFFRPETADYEAKSITVEDCEFIDGAAAIAFVGVDGALVQHNTIYRPRRWPLRILQETTEPRFVACRNGRFVNNVIAFRSDEVRETVNIGPDTAPESFIFTGNLWHCLDRPADTRRLIRLPVAETGGIYDREPGFANAASGDLRIPSRQPNDPGVRTVP